MKKTLLKLFSFILLVWLFSISLNATTYYSTGSTNLNTLTNWNTERNGTGTSPTDFVSPGDVFVIQGSGNGGTTPHQMTMDDAMTIGSADHNTKLQIENGASLTANHALTFGTAGQFQIDNGGTYIHDNTGSFGSTILQGVENFATNSNFVIQHSLSTGPANPANGGFGNLTINITTLFASVDCSGEVTAIKGNLRIVKTGDGSQFRLSGLAGYILNIGGDLIIEGGILNLTHTISNTGASYIVNLSGNFTMSGGKLVIDGNTISGDLYAYINFVKPGVQTFTKTGGSIEPLHTNRHIVFAVKSGTTLDMGTSILDAPSSEHRVDFNVESGATLKMGDAGGIVAQGTTATTGNIRTNSDAVRNFSSGATYIYSGTSAQVAGTGLPSTVAGLTINNSSGVTLSNPISITGTLDVSSGSQLTLSPGTTLTASSLINNGDVNTGSDASGTATILPATISGTGSYNISQYLPHARNWYVSSPVSNAKAKSGYTFYSWDESLLTGTNGWVTMTTGNGTTTGAVLNPGKGYIALPGAAASTLTFTGTLNTGDVDVAISNSGSGSTKGFNLIGNPYPCHLTWTKTFVDNNTAKILPTIWYRTNAGTANNSGQWSFKTYNASTGEASPAGTTGIIPPMQAFWVKAADAGTLTLNSDLTKSHQSSNPLKVPAIINTDRKRLRLQVSNGTNTDETLMYFDAAASNNFDRYDSPKMFVNSASMAEIYTQTGSEKLVINGMSSLTGDKTIPLGFVAQQAGNFSISAIEVGNFDSGVKIMLKDNQAGGAEFDLTGGMAYNFSSAATSASTDRFSVILRSASTATGVAATQLSGQVYVDALNRVVLNTPANATYSVYNSNGQTVLRGTTMKENMILTGFRPTAGIYLVKVQSEGKILSSRVVIR